MKEEEKLLVEQARDGSEKAFSKLYQKYNKTIWFTIYNIVKNSDVADDLTSVVFTKVYEKLQTYVNHISFEMWLKTIAVNASIDYIRRTKKEQLNNYIDDDEYTGQLDSNTKSPEEQMILSQNVEVIMKCIPLLRKKPVPSCRKERQYLGYDLRYAARTSVRRCPGMEHFPSVTDASG